MKCRVCDSHHLDSVIDLGLQPLANHFLHEHEVGKEPTYPLNVFFCHHCSTAQLDHTVKKEVIFGDHTYLSGITRTLSDHFRSVAEDLDQRFFKNHTHKAVMDIGSNDGTQLKHFQDMGWEVQGVESTRRIAEVAWAAGIPTLNAFFNQDVARSLNKKFQVINAAGVFYHLEELHSVTDGIREALADDGVFVIQFAYVKRIIENLAFDHIYHEHLLYYTLKTVQELLQRHGLSLFDANLSSVHGGYMIAFATHQKNCPTASQRLTALRQAEDKARCNDASTYVAFAERIKQMKTENLEYLTDAKAKSKSIYGMGAPVKGNTLLNYFGVGTQFLDLLIEKNAFRKGLYSPGQHIRVELEHELPNPPDIYYVLAWNFKEEILRNNRHLIDQGVEFYFPVDPKPIG